MFKSPPAKHAFSLVELSIVLVILGLLIGGILSGQALIKAAELRSIHTDVSRYITSTQTFRDKYFALPGDMTNATSFWNTDVAGCPNGGGSTGVCNGDGNGRIGYQMNNCENQEFWRHLAHAGLVEGSFIPLTAGSCYAMNVIGTTIARSRFSKTAIGAYYLGSITSGAVWPGNGFYTADYSNAFIVGGVNSVNYMNLESTLSTEDAWNIDTKMDDGSPDSGTVYSMRLGGYSNCPTNATPGSADYNLALAGLQCSLIIKAGF
jgi:prepilin-type N-terminal cleavage/methylation domain-containing protein